MYAPLVLLSFVLPALAGVQELWWNVTYVEDQNPDGLFSRRVIGVNNTWPPPPIVVSTDDTLLLHATNSLSAPLTIHHHGMFFNATSWMDGAMGVSQCGIPPGASFTYVVPVNESGQTGTYWVHAHSKGQYVDGLRAPLLLVPPTEAYQYDEEFTVVLGDWYHQEHDVLIQQFISIANPGGAEPVPDSGLIYFADANGNYLPGFNDNATLPFTPGKTYRLRIVNTSAFAAFFFWIDGHDMKIIEVDGTDTEEFATDVISLSVAQRYSILVTARNDTSSNWAIHGNMDTDMFDTVPDSLNPNITSSITYSQGAAITSNDAPADYPPTGIDDTSLVPIPAEAQLPPANHTIPLLVAFDTMTDGTNHAMFNGITYNSPLVPAVLSALTLNGTTTLSNGTTIINAEYEPAYGPLSFVLEEGDIVDLVVFNSDAGKHPFHLHGHKFQIVSRTTDYTSDDPSLNPPLQEGQANPVRRDTLQIPSMGSATLRFVANNPGVWFFHCHIEWHLEVGLAIQLISAPLKMQELAMSNPPPSEIASQCAAQNIMTSGNAAGHSDIFDLSGLPLGPYTQNLGWHSKGIGAMAGCVLTAVLGMLAVVWYSLGGQISHEDQVAEEQRKLDAKEERNAAIRNFGKKILGGGDAKK